MPGLSEGIFSHSITYICEHGESGAMGIVINQPLDLSVGEIFEHLQIDSERDFSDEPVMAGGGLEKIRLISPPEQGSAVQILGDGVAAVPRIIEILQELRLV